MILIADSGSTKTDWACLYRASAPQCLRTQGINPFHQTPDTIRHILHTELLPALQGAVPEAVYFYGAGCTPAQSPRLAGCLQQLWPSASPHTEVHTDLLGAARALCAHRPGIACILGTGSNSCYYDGERIARHVPPLGYILGDEGSGAYLGRCLAGDCLKGLLPEERRTQFLQRFGLTAETLLDKVYREPLANRFLAGLTPFLWEHRHEADIRRLLVDGFETFARRNLLAYPPAPVHAVGSIAHFFHHELAEALAACGLSLGTVLRSPLEGLIGYHTPINR